MKSYQELTFELTGRSDQVARGPYTWINQSFHSLLNYLIMSDNKYLICYDLNEAMDRQIFEHPRVILEKLGIRFKSLSFDRILNQWLFHGCTNTPVDVPDQFSKIQYPVQSPDPSGGT